VHLAVLVGTSVVLDEAKLSELIHEKIDARACSSDHRCQGPLRYSGKSVPVALIPLAREQQKSAGKSPLAACKTRKDRVPGGVAHSAISLSLDWVIRLMEILL
jgi:hypothetical protein